MKYPDRLLADTKFVYTDAHHCEAKDALTTLDKYGVAVIPNLIPEKKCLSFRKQLWDELYQLTKDWDTPIEEKKPETYRQIFKLCLLHSMLIQYHKVGHFNTVWAIRQLPEIVNVFSGIYNCDPGDLLVSFDGLSWHMPFEVTKRGYFRGNCWLHTDERPGKEGYKLVRTVDGKKEERIVSCIQGMVNLYPVNEGDATLSVLEESHKYHAEMFDEFDLADFKSDWFKINKEQLDWYNKKGCKQRCITAPIGSLTLWYSRTIHQGLEPMRDRENPNFRLVVYTCYTPRSMASEKMLVKRVKAFEEKRMTNHWPHDAKLFAKKPRTYGGEVPVISYDPEPKINELGRRLIGYEK